MIIHDDCLTAMAGMEPESVDAIVTDPPYGLEFMSKEWDRLFDKRESGGFKTGGLGTNIAGRKASGPTYRAGLPAQAWHQRWAEAAYRVAKPSAYLLAFGGTRTVHRMTVALEDAGWIIRDMLVWAYASGFPKSKASLKPAWEPIVMARKPGPLRMLAIDLCRIPGAEDGSRNRPPSRLGSDTTYAQDEWTRTAVVERQDTTGLGRWPSNVLLSPTGDGLPDIFDGGVDGVVGGGETSTTGVRQDFGQSKPGALFGWEKQRSEGEYTDSGTYSRFFLIPKADRADREPVLGGHGLTPGMQGGADGTWIPGSHSGPRANVHPTVKPTELMRHLVRLVTPAGGTVLDPFGGSGTTALACELEGFPWILIEKEREYCDIAEARLNGTQRGLGLAG